MILAAIVALTGCGEGGSGATVPDDFVADDCIVRVHGRSDSGSPPTLSDGVGVLSPDANSEWEGGGRVWIYDSEASLADARAKLDEVIAAAGCERVVLHGFSNGAAFTGALLCTGEDFDGRLVGAILDDPVTDNSSPACATADVPIVAYWTGALQDTVAQGSCEAAGWTCAGGDQLLSIDEYAQRLGAPVRSSIHEEHRPYDDAPELDDWLT